MTLKVGDRVVVIDATTKGVVTGVEGDCILVEEANGFELSYRKSQLAKVTEDQSALSRYADIDNVMLRQKMTASKNTKKQVSKKKNKQPEKPPMEVDLHIEKLVKNPAGMSNTNILNLQLDTAKHKLEFALRKRIPILVFIHGVGEGVLQRELSYLFAKYPVQTSQASFRKYGMGATEVYVLQNRKNQSSEGFERRF